MYTINIYYFLFKVQRHHLVPVLQQRLYRRSLFYVTALRHCQTTTASVQTLPLLRHRTASLPYNSVCTDAPSSTSRHCVTARQQQRLYRPSLFYLTALRHCQTTTASVRTLPLLRHRTASLPYNSVCTGAPSSTSWHCVTARQQQRLYRRSLFYVTALHHCPAQTVVTLTT
ncbi:hypothetical protein NN561_013178 [Cricetulus griseus]